MRDASTLDALPAFKAAAEHGRRVYVVTTYPNGSEHHRTGRIGRTTGTRPAYLVMHRADQLGSWDLIDERDTERTRIVATQRPDGTYTTPDHRRVHPGRNRFTNPNNN